MSRQLETDEIRPKTKAAYEKRLVIISGEVDSYGCVPVKEPETKNYPKGRWYLVRVSRLYEWEGVDALASA